MMRGLVLLGFLHVVQGFHVVPGKVSVGVGCSPSAMIGSAIIPGVR